METYVIEECCVFSKAKEKWGEFGNMTGGFPLRIFRDILVCSSESLYQAMRFPHHPDIQKEILDQKSGMGAKMVSKKYRAEKTHEEFEDNKEEIMEWCLRIKAKQHKKYRDALLETGNSQIVEFSKKDDFWGAKFNEDETLLIGENKLGKLHEKLREEIKQGSILSVQPVDMSCFKLLNRQIEVL